MTAPQVSVVIPFYNRASFAARCLRSVLRQKTTFSFEVVAIDNNSTDGTKDELRRFKEVRFVECTTQGAAAARNAGIEAAHAPIIAFFDSDCLAAPGWLEALVRPLLDDPKVVLTGGRIRGLRMDRGVAFYLQVSRRIDQRLFMVGRSLLPPFFATANCAYRKAAIERAGGFDESIHVSEDAELAWRVLDAGGTMIYEPKAVVAHDHRTTFRDLFRMAGSYGEASAHAFAKHRHRMGRAASIDWQGWLAAAMQPLEAVRQLAFERRPVFNRWFVYESIWLTGFHLGKIRGSLKHGVVFL